MTRIAPPEAFWRVGPAVRAIEVSGEPAVASAVSAAIVPYKSADGGFDLRNDFRFIVAKRA